jgi:5-methylcytosine-specific restriction endonuclease McrA
MPIKAELKHLYPPDWEDIRAARLVKAGNSCEHCGIMNGAPLNPRKGRHYPRGSTGPVVVLTIAHLDHDPTNNTDENLRALCQKCHNRHDAKHRGQSRRATRRRRIEQTQATLEIPNGTAGAGQPAQANPARGVQEP